MDRVARTSGAIRTAKSRRPGPRPFTYAALDLGTNNCRLLIARAEPDGRDFRVIDGFSRIVRLGEGIGARPAQPILGEAAIRRAIRALHVCANKMRRRGVDRARCVATEACRRATNAAQFLGRVRAETGMHIETISCMEEATLAMSGCAPLLDGAFRRALIFDIGGGSTELTWVALARDGDHRVLGCDSIPCGVVTLSEQFGGDCYDRATYQAMIDRVFGLLRPFEAAHGIGAEIAAGGVQMLGTSGTVTTLAGVHMALDRYDRTKVDGTELDFETVARVSARLRGLDYQGRAADPCVGRDRADLVVGGCAVLEAICLLWPVGRLRVADRGVREGILYALMGAAPAMPSTGQPGF
ncbi:MAG: Ppx/GppA phosphatase family protein [Alphaproteobacteria bacterium]|nr:Ppx/GppA phosphatase family protein [Alphaproteobacteria bacterium]MDP6517561.1 Ppx/GppA phosphatase family protein [Alphaproteobacteria bacterium]